MAAKYVSEIEDVTRTEASITIDKLTVPDYWDPSTIITYRKGGKVLKWISGNVHV